MKFRQFYIKHQDTIELTKAYAGVILILILAISFNWVPNHLEGLFNNQVEMIIDSCINGFNVGGCP